MARYTLVSKDELANLKYAPSSAQTQVYDALNGNTGANDNFFTKRAKSVDNAVGTTGAAVAAFAKDTAENIGTANLLKDTKTSMNDIAKKYGYNTYHDVWDARDAAAASGDQATLDLIDNTINPQLQAQANINANKANEKAARYQDYMQNNDVSKRINQDRGKFLGSAINTLSTATDVLGLTNGPVSNAIQGGIEGIADELEQNGLQNFDWGRAGQNALTGAASGAAVGLVNKGLSNSLAKKGGNLFKGGNKLTQGLNNLGSKTAVGRGISTLATGAGRGAISGAVGGATGAGLQSALNGVELGQGIANTFQGAAQGAGQGALAGTAMAGANMALNKTPFMQKVNQANQDWQSSGDNFKERWANTRDSGDSWIGNKINDFRAKPANYEDIGLRYNQFANDPIKSIDYLMKRGGGEVEGAVKSPAVGELTGDDKIDLVYGDASKNKGLAHIVEKHGIEAAYKIPDILQNGEVDPLNTNVKNGKITVVGKDGTGGVRLDYNGAKKQWVVSAFEGEPINHQFTSASGANASAGATSGDPFGRSQSEAPIDSSIPQNEQNVNDLTSVFEPDANKTIQNRNKLQSVGQQLQTAAKTQKYGALYDSLDAKTAAREVKTGAPETLAKLGVRPENYLEAAKTSDYVNKVVSDLAEQSNVKVNVPDLVDRLSLDNVDVIMSEPAAKKYNSYIKQIIPDGSTPDEYSAGYLLQKSRELGNKAANLRGNTDDVNTLRTALTDAKYTLRDLAASALENSGLTGDLTNDNIAKGLAKMGANEAIQDYYTEAVDGKAPSITDYIRRSSLFEQARDMGTQIEAEKYTRSASKAPTNPFTRIWNATGLDQPVNTLLKSTVAPIAGGLTNVSGKVVEGAGNLAAKVGGNAPSLTVATPSVSNAAYAPATQIYNAIGRTEGEIQGEQAAANYLTEAANNTEPVAIDNNTQGTASTAVYDAFNGTTTSSPASTSTGRTTMTSGDYYTDLLGRAMQMALDDNNAAAYVALLQMYQEAAAKQSNTNTEQVKLTDKQRQANAAALALDELEQLTPDTAYNLSDIPVIGGIATLGGNSYETAAKSLAQQVGYMLSGANVTKDEAENIGKAYVPLPRDNETIRQQKLNKIRGIISEYQRTYSE